MHKNRGKIERENEETEMDRRIREMMNRWTRKKGGKAGSGRQTGGILHREERLREQMDA